MCLPTFVRWCFLACVFMYLCMFVHVFAFLYSFISLPYTFTFILVTSSFRLDILSFLLPSFWLVHFIPSFLTLT